MRLCLYPVLQARKDHPCPRPVLNTKEVGVTLGSQQDNAIWFSSPESLITPRNLWRPGQCHFCTTQIKRGAVVFTFNHTDRQATVSYCTPTKWLLSDDHSAEHGRKDSPFLALSWWWAHTSSRAACKTWKTHIQVISKTPKAMKINKELKEIHMDFFLFKVGNAH